LFETSTNLKFIYRTAFSEFDAEIVANLTDKQMISISSEYGIDISKVRGVVDNANQILQVKIMYPFHHSFQSNSLRDILVETNRIVNCFFPLFIIFFFYNSLIDKKKKLQTSKFQ
jgi:hypothetical protein